MAAKHANILVDGVVLITDDGIPPLQWSIGRVMQLKLGHDGVARVALVRESRGEFTRPASELRRLRVKENNIVSANSKRHAQRSSSTKADNETTGSGAVENINAAVTHCDPPGWWFEPCTHITLLRRSGEKVPIS